MLLASKMVRRQPEDNTSNQLVVTAVTAINEGKIITYKKILSVKLGVTSLQNVSRVTMTENIAKQQEVNSSKALLQNTVLTLSNPFLTEEGTPAQVSQYVSMKFPRIFFFLINLVDFISNIEGRMILLLII